VTWSPVLSPVADPEPHRPLVVVLGPESDALDVAAEHFGAPRCDWLRDSITALVVGWDLGTPELGPPSLVPGHRWMAAVRRLLLTSLGDRAAVALPGPVWLVMYVRRVFPDATLVHVHAPGEDAEWDDRLNDLCQEPDLVIDPSSPDWVSGLPPRPAAAVPLAAGPGTRGDRLLFVLGCARSGTTWLHRLLCASPEVSGPPLGETSVFRMLEPLWKESRGTDPRVTTGLRAFVQEVLLEPFPAVRVVCEKTPAHIWVIPMLRDLLPDAAFVHIVRDGRDVGLSLLAVDGATDLRAAGEAWARGIERIGQDLEGAPRQHLVRYEDLLQDADAVLLRLWAGLGVPPGDLRERVGQQVTPLPSHRPPGSHRWGELPPADLAALTDGCGPALRDWGYRP
jgi:hypothetical protein